MWMFRVGLFFIFMIIRGGIKKKLFFFQKNSERGGRGLAESEIFLSEKTEIFLEFFFERGGSHLFQKGVIIKNGDIGIFSPKRGLSPNP